MVYLAAKFFNANGGDIDATCAYLDTLVQNVAVLFVVDDLKYLARGGRLSPAKAAIGNVLQLKPVLYVNREGEIDVLTKQKGAKKAMSYIVSSFEQKYRPREGRSRRARRRGLRRGGRRAQVPRGNLWCRAPRYSSSPSVPSSERTAAPAPTASSLRRSPDDSPGGKVMKRSTALKLTAALLAVFVLLTGACRLQ